MHLRCSTLEINGEDLPTAAPTVPGNAMAGQQRKSGSLKSVQIASLRSHQLPTHPAIVEVVWGKHQSVLVRSIGSKEIQWCRRTVGKSQPIRCGPVVARTGQVLRSLRHGGQHLVLRQKWGEKDMATVNVSGFVQNSAAPEQSSTIQLTPETIMLYTAADRSNENWEN